MSPAPSVDHCPNCGAPLELDDQGDCHWCHAPVTRAPGLSDRADADVVANVTGQEQLNLPKTDVYLPLPVFPLLACLNTSAYDPAVRVFLAASARVDSIRALARAAETAGHRLQDADVDQDDVVDRGERIYTPDELWCFDLLADLLARLEHLDGIERDTRSSLKENVSAHDGMWNQRVGRALKQAGDGPEQFRSLRAAIPRRH